MLAEQVVLREDGIVRIPEGLSFEEASTLPCAGVTAWNALMEGPVRTLPGGSILIQGSGGVSVFALQLARAAGLRVFGISSSDAKLERLRALGMESGVNYKTHPDWAEEVRKLTGGEGVDGVVEVSGTIRQSLHAVKYGGWISPDRRRGRRLGRNSQPWSDLRRRRPGASGFCRVGRDAAVPGSSRRGQPHPSGHRSSL